MRTSVYCSAVDLIGEGVSRVIGRVREADLGGVTLAAVYHEARDYLPHNPRFRVHYTPAGVCFAADASRYPRELPPPPLLPVCDRTDLLATTCTRAAQGDAQVNAWVVYLHHDGPPGYGGVVENAFGDPYPVSLCPAAPISQDYAVALTADVCKYDIGSIAAEALHYLPFDHGFHHERRFAPLSGLNQFLLSLCFCRWCRAAADTDGLDVDRLARWVRHTVDHSPPWEPGVVGREQVSTLAGGELGGFLNLREAHVAALTARCADVATTAGVGFRFLDLSAAIEGWTHGKPTGPLGVDSGWLLGVDIGRLDRRCDVVAAPYAYDPVRVTTELSAYRGHIPADRFGVILRPMGPDCDDASNLADKISRVEQVGATSIDYYHYGLMERASLAAISAAHRAHAAAGPTTADDGSAPRGRTTDDHQQSRPAP